MSPKLPLTIVITTENVELLYRDCKKYWQLMHVLTVNCGFLEIYRVRSAPTRTHPASLKITKNMKK